MSFLNWILCILIGYLLGCFPTATLVCRLYGKDDVRNHGSGNAGSTNMVRVYGILPGLMTFLGDFLKAVAGYFLGCLLMGLVGGYIAGFAVVVGHCWPVFAGFHGGKGAASSCGIAIAVFPLGALAALAAGAVLFAITKRVSIMSLSSVTILFVLMLIFKHDNLPLIILGALLAAVMFIRHRENIARLIRGEEPKLIPKGK